MDAFCLSYLEDRASILCGRVLDVGSYNENGEVRSVIPVDVGIDMRAGPGVDLVCLAEDLLDHFAPESFDSITCLNTMEHVEHWREALAAIWACLKPGGVLVLGVPNRSKGVHGYPKDYWRWTDSDLEYIFGVKPKVNGKLQILTVRKMGPLPDLTAVEPLRVSG
jgi:SAM-dependent methyltransferase